MKWDIIFRIKILYKTGYSVNWNELLHGVPVFEAKPYVERPMANEFRPTSRMSEVSNLTDITVNYNGNELLRTECCLVIT